MLHNNFVSKLYREYKQFKELSILKRIELKDSYPKLKLKLFKLIDKLCSYTKYWQ